MTLTNRDAASYAIFRHADIHGRRIHIDDALAIIADIEEVVPGLAALLDKPWKRPRWSRDASAQLTTDKGTTP